MTFLRKVGQLLGAGLKILTGIGPVVSTFVPNAAGELVKVENTLEQVAQVVMQAEAMGQAINLPGPQKLAAATPLVRQVILVFCKAKGLDITDEAKFNTAIAGITGGVADLLNSVHEHSAKTEDAS